MYINTLRYAEAAAFSYIVSSRYVSRQQGQSSCCFVVSHPIIQSLWKTCSHDGLLDSQTSWRSWNSPKQIAQPAPSSVAHGASTSSCGTGGLRVDPSSGIGLLSLGPVSAVALSEAHSLTTNMFEIHSFLAFLSCSLVVLCCCAAVARTISEVGARLRNNLPKQRRMANKRMSRTQNTVNTTAWVNSRTINLSASPTTRRTCQHVFHKDCTVWSVAQHETARRLPNVSRTISTSTQDRTLVYL
jgi:hypothetical protein